MEHNRKQNPGRILLIYNPNGVVDRDIYLAAKNSRFHIKSCKIAVSRTPEGHTVEKIDLMSMGKDMLALQPDFLLTVNGAGLDNEGLLAYLCAYMEIPLVLWFVDEPFFIPEWGEKFLPQSTVAFTFDRFYEKRLRNWGIPWVYTLPLGTNHERMQIDDRFAKKHPSPAHTVSFVGSLEYEKIQYLLKNIFTLWKPMPPFLVDVMERAVEQYRLTPTQEVEDIISRCVDQLGEPFRFPNNIVKQMVLSFIDREASFRLRHETVQLLKPFEIAVFGEPFWKRAIGKPFYKGRINYYSDEISKVYASSRINLNISKYQLKTTVNQRVFDCPLSNGFLLTDYKEDIEQYFEIGKSIAVYYDHDDLDKKIAYYLANEDQARHIVENGKDVIYENHTYDQRLRTMVQKVQQIKENGTFKSISRNVIKRNPPPKFRLFLKALQETGNTVQPESISDGIER